LRTGDAILSADLSWKGETMKKLTKNMQKVLKSADLERGEINDVPLRTTYGLLERRLIRKKGRGGWYERSRTTMSGRFPHSHGIQLTEAGVRVARSLKGLS